MTQLFDFKIGQIWETRDGFLVQIDRFENRSILTDHPIRVKMINQPFADYSITVNGRFISNEISDVFDLVRMVQDILI